jgi:hypothetical protein
MKHLVLITLALTVPFLTGCPKSTPKVPSVLARQVANYEISRFEQDEKEYYCAIDGLFEGNTSACSGLKVNDVAEATKYRNRIIDRLKSAIDSNYHQFENQLFTGRATANVLFDIVDFGSGVATTITNGARAKSIISAALTGFKGGRKSLDENFFKERTTAVIISQMQASRAHIEAEMLTNLNANDATIYSLDAGLGDLIDYFYAGTLQKGIQELAQQTGQNAIAEKKNVEAAREKGRLGVTEIVVERAEENKSLYNQLRKNALTPPIDAKKQADAVSRARFAIKQLSGIEPDPDLKPSELFDALGQAMRDLDREDPVGATDKINNALKGKP